jgi:signal transduction histidine kinase
MQRTVEKTKLSGVQGQILSTSEKPENRAALSKTATTAPVFVGLTHLIHQINNPIQLVYGATGLMDQELARTKRDNCFLDQVFQTLKGGVDQLVAMVSALRSQMECFWVVDPAFSAVNLNSVIDEILEAEAAPFDAGEIHVRRCMATNLPPIRGNEKLLKQAFINVLKNAAEAMPEGGVLSVRTGACERSVFVEVADSGHGIPPDMDIFQPFVTSKAGVMGLGLTIVRHIVESHDGTITYRSQSKNGTIFSLDFPWAPETTWV